MAIASDLHPAGPGRISIVRSVRVEASREVVAEVLSAWELLTLYEHKVQRAVVRQRTDDGRGAEVAIEGRFAFVPYSGRLLFSSRPAGGFDSVLIQSSTLVGFSGSFGVRRDGDGCIVTHVEQYKFRGGRFGWLLGLLLRPFLAASMEGEMRRLKRVVEDPSLLAAARRGLRLRVRAERGVVVWDPALRKRREAAT